MPDESSLHQKASLFTRICAGVAAEGAHLDTATIGPTNPRSQRKIDAHPSPCPLAVSGEGVSVLMALDSAGQYGGSIKMRSGRGSESETPVHELKGVPRVQETWNRNTESAREGNCEEGRARETCERGGSRLSLPPLVPPLKCQGMKTKLVGEIRKLARCQNFERWVEPFCGSCVVPSNVQPRKALRCDTNIHIIRG
jgi:hypothetical protein